MAALHDEAYRMVTQLVSLWRLELAILPRVLSLGVPRELLQILLRELEVGLREVKGLLFVEEWALVYYRLVSRQDGVDLLQGEIVLVVESRLLRGEVGRDYHSIGLPLTCSLVSLVDREHGYFVLEG